MKRNKILSFLSEASGIRVGDLRPDADIQQDLGVTSLKIMRILASVEARYGVDLDEAKILNVRTINDFLDLVEDTLEFQR